MADVGLRVNEACKLDLADVKWDLGLFGKLHVRHGKGARGSGHFCASELYLAGMDLIAIQATLGHAWIATTMNYVNPRELHQMNAFALVA
jgi:integrase